MIQTLAAGQNARAGFNRFAYLPVKVFENIKTALAAGGASFADLVKITVYVTDPRYREAVGEVRRRYLGDALPASTLVVVAGLANPDYLLEIEGVAVVG